MTYVFHLRQGVKFHDGRAAQLCGREIHIRFDSRRDGENAEARSISNGHSRSRLRTT